jgi:hypothetical protein
LEPFLDGQLCHRRSLSSFSKSPPPHTPTHP